MGGPAQQRLPKPPPPPDVARAQVQALAYAEVQRRLRESQGQAGQLKLPNAQVARPAGFKSALGM